MFSNIRNFLHRHRRKFVITGAIVGGLYLLSSYAQRKLREWQEKEAKKFIEMTRKKQHFESTERTCNQTILSLSKIVIESILGSLNTEEILQKLREQPENKLELWEQMKVLIFTRICVLVYALCILQVTLRVQLNIIGGYLYKESAHEGDNFIDSNLQAKYFSLCHHFIGQGVENLIKKIEKAVVRIVEPVSLKKKITLHEVEQMFWSVQTILCTENGDPVKEMAHYLVGHTEINDPKLDTIVKETMDILESDEVTSITMSSVSRSFSSVIDEIANLFISKSTPTTKNHLELGVENHVMTNGALKLQSSTDTFVDVNKVELYFVKLLPVINELITKNTCKGNTNIPDMLTQHLTLNEKVKLLGANIYEVFSSAE